MARRAEMTDRIVELMQEPNNIRNLSVIAHVDHGKTTLSDSLLSRAGLLREQDAGSKCELDHEPQEADRGVTIKSTSVSLYYESKGVPYLINLIDSPGHADFSSEVTAALRVTDGALVVVDCIEGVCVQTETVLRQAISEQIKPVLFLNKLDRMFLELDLEPEEAYTLLRNAIESVNVVIGTFAPERDDLQLDPRQGTVGFGSGLHAWGFTLENFAKAYSAKDGTSVEKYMKRMWGDRFYNPKTRKWGRKAFSESGERLERGFVRLVWKPIALLIKAIMEEDSAKYEAMFRTLGIKVPPKDLEKVKKPKDLVKAAMRRWLPCGDTLLDMVTTHLPSPVTAQKYRATNLYSGPADDESCGAIRACSADGPLMMYISKLVSSADGRWYAFGRVFSGTVRPGIEVQILNSDYVPGSRSGRVVKKIQGVRMMMGPKVSSIPHCSAGCVASVTGVDSFILKSATLADVALTETHIFKTMAFSVSPVVKVAVEPKSARDLPKLVNGLKRLAKADSLVVVSTSSLGEHLIAGAGELHLETCIYDLEHKYMKGVGIRTSKPVVSYAETVSIDGMKCLAKSPNRHNRLFATASALGADLCADIDKGVVKRSDDMKERGRYLRETYNWDADLARKIWTFGVQPDAEANMLINATRGVANVQEISDAMVATFLQYSGSGAIAGEKVRGLRIDLVDCKLHADTVHRGAGAIMPAAKKVYSACHLSAGPRLMEPMYLVDITVPRGSALASVYDCLSQKRASFGEELERPGTPLVQLQAYLPVAESFGFPGLLSEKTSGQAFPQMRFSHWQLIDSDIYQEGTQANQVVREIRQRKGLKDQIPVYQDFLDRM